MERQHLASAGNATGVGRLDIVRKTVVLTERKTPIKTDSIYNEGFFMAYNTGELPKMDWLVDSACTSHVAIHREWFDTFCPMEAELATGEGSSQVELWDDKVLDRCRKRACIKC